MKYCGRMLVCVLVGVALNVGAIVSVSNVKDGSYQAIARRNIFGLLPPVNSGTEPTAPVISRPGITLAGITTLLGYKAAFLMLPADRVSGARECLLLREGETHEEIQVREIDQKVGAVKVINHGEEETLGFDDDVGKPESVPVDVIIDVDRINPSPMPPAEKASLTPEQQTLLIESQRLKAIQDGDPVAKILPPTEMTAEITNTTP